MISIDDEFDSYEWCFGAVSTTGRQQFSVHEYPTGKWTRCQTESLHHHPPWQRILVLAGQLWLANTCHERPVTSKVMILLGRTSMVSSEGNEQIDEPLTLQWFG